MTKTIVFIHGAFVGPMCWDNFKGFFEAKGYQCLTPTWPYKGRSIEEQRRSPLPELGRLGITEIVDHHEKIIRGLSEPPMLIGHSYGGLFVQMLLDRGLGTAGVAIDSAPPKGILPFYPSAIKSLLWVLVTLGGWRKVIRTNPGRFAYGFLNTVPEAERQTIYDKYVIPETGRIFFQAAYSMFNNTTRVNYKNDKRAPLLLIAGGSDHIVPPQINRSNFKKYKNTSARTDFKEFENRCHWIISQAGWEEVAGYSFEWLNKS
jgi:pimeloyl-ACP methyl ester carboxylesterase